MVAHGGCVVGELGGDGRVIKVIVDGGYPTMQARDIFQRLVPEWSALFLAKNEKYKAVGNDLGPRGVFPDINRKTGILKSVLWDGESLPAGSESAREVVMDLIGHLFLVLHMMDGEQIAKEMEAVDRGG